MLVDMRWVALLFLIVTKSPSPPPPPPPPSTVITAAILVCVEERKEEVSGAAYPERWLVVSCMHIDMGLAAGLFIVLLVSHSLF